jgi:hypothetical protein
LRQPLKIEQLQEGRAGEMPRKTQAALFLFSGSQHFIDAGDDLSGVLDRSLALLDLCQEKLTFFLCFGDEFG